MNPIITLTDQPDQESINVISSGLDRFNEQQTGVQHAQTIAVLLRDSQGTQTLGGLLGRISLGWLFVDLFFVPEAFRGKGMGKRLILLAEEEARRQGCRYSVLYTITFQAPAFYERCGYRTFGRIECDPPGHARVFMVKELR